MRKVIKITFDGQERLWHSAQATLDPGHFGLIFEFRFASLYSQDNAGIDKISVTEGECQPTGEHPGNPEGPGAWHTHTHAHPQTAVCKGSQI